MGNQQSEAKKLSLEDFELVRLIGKGAFGKVWMVRRKEFGDIYAMKVLHKQSVVDQNLIEHTLLERDVMLMCNNPFIINLYWSFQTEENLYFVVDFIGGGSLWNQLVDNEQGYFSEDNVRFYASEIILGIEELHSKGIVYRDLKPENILINTDGHIVLTDFGLSARNHNGKVHSFSGTAIYIAPEVLLEEGHNHAVDWWSFGVVLYLLLAGEPPFWSENKKELFEMIKAAKINLNHRLLHPAARDLIGKLLNRDASARLGSKEGAAELKRHPFFAGINWNRVLKKKLKPPYIPSTELILKSSSLAMDSSPNGQIGQTKTCIEHFKGFSFTREKPDSLSTSDEILKRALTFTDEIPITRKRKMKKKLIKEAALKKKSVEVTESELKKLQLLREQASRDNRNRTFINIRPQGDNTSPTVPSLPMEKGRCYSIAQPAPPPMPLSPASNASRSRSVSLGSAADF